MSNYRILRDKQNIPDAENDSTDHTKIFNRANVPRHSQRVHLAQQKRKHAEVEPQPQKFHAGIQKNTKVAIQPHTHEMRDLKTDKPKVSKPGSSSTNTGPTVTFRGPREAFQMKPEVLHILNTVLEKVEKIPLPQKNPETQQVNQQELNSLAILNGAIRKIEGTETIDNAQQPKDIVVKKTKKSQENITNSKAVRIGAAIPDAVDILNATVIKPEEYQSSQGPELSNDNLGYSIESEYHEDILNYMRALEIKLCKPKACYMDKQPELTGAMRTKLVDWLVHVFQETDAKVLHMTVNYIDTFLSRMSVVKSKFQLLACAAGMIACKMEEVHLWHAQYWVTLGGKSFTQNQLLKMERIILSVLKFELSRPTTVCFIRHICFSAKVNTKDAVLANYLSELVLVEGDVYLHYSPSSIACAIIALARHTLGQRDIWPQKLRAVTKHTLQQLFPLFAMLRKTFNTARNNPNTFVTKKYSDKLFHEVAKLNLKHLDM